MEEELLEFLKRKEHAPRKNFNNLLNKHEPYLELVQRALGPIDYQHSRIQRGGQSTDGWAGPQATGMCFRHTIEAAPTARVDGVNLYENTANFAETRLCQVLLGFVTERTEDGDNVCARTRPIWPRRDRVKCRTAQ
ncbi:hypothetical protein V6N13_034113 [Hibiscus sabdariffa]